MPQLRQGEARAARLLMPLNAGFDSILTTRRILSGLTCWRGISHVIPTTRRIIAYARDGKWWPVIEYYTLDDDEHLALLRAMAGYARRFVIGPDEKTMQRYLTKKPPPTRSIEPSEFGFMTGRRAARWEMTYFSTLTKLCAPPDASIMRLDLDQDNP